MSAHRLKSTASAFLSLRTQPNTKLGTNESSPGDSNLNLEG